MEVLPWVTFCISTYKRPAFLEKQLSSFLKQTFRNFEVVISDNDPEGSAAEVVSSLGDKRFKYFHNDENLGMIRSFNKSIDRASTEYIVMVTDDDPVQTNFLEEMYQLYTGYPGYSIYCGFERKNKKEGEIEVIAKENFIMEILSPFKTAAILWSSAVMQREAAIKVGKIPDYGSPHLADHALIALVGSECGGLVVNKMYSHITMHDNNFSKFNFHYYISGCKGFYQVMMHYAAEKKVNPASEAVIIKHIGNWFLTNVFNLKKYYTIKKDPLQLKYVEECGKEILKLSFMKQFLFKFHTKNAIFKLKKGIRRL